jgi:hypothetical protein
MANTRFVPSTRNRLTLPVAILKNGAGGPALVQDPAYPMSNLMNNDRGSVWSTGITAVNPIYVHIDMGSNQVIRIFAILGMQALAGGFLPSQVAVGYRTGTYSSVPGDYTSAGLMFATTADTMLELTPTTMRFIQFTLVMPGTGWGNGFSLGKFLAAAVIDDMGMVYSPGSVHRGIVVPQIRSESQSGAVHITRTGPNYLTFNLEFRKIDNTTVGRLSSIAALGEVPFLYIDQNNAPYECIVADAEWQRVHLWSPPDLWDAALSFRQLA